MYTVYLSHHVDIIIVQKYFILKSILKILFYFVFSKYFVAVFYFCNFKILFQSILHITGQMLFLPQKYNIIISVIR